MKRCIQKIILFVLISALLCPGAVFAAEQSVESVCAVYLGVYSYGSDELWAGAFPSFLYRFFSAGEELLLPIDDGDDYAVQNTLQEGGVYRLVLQEGTVTQAEEITESDIYDANALEENVRCWKIEKAPGGAQVYEADAQTGEAVIVVPDGKGVTDLYIMPDTVAYTPPVSGEPGLATLKNLLATAMAPVGTVLYVQGGGKNWQNDGSGPQAGTTGLSEEWIEFFLSQDEDYTYRGEDPAVSYYPAGGFNEYYYAGLDGEGYLSWVLHNTFAADARGGADFLSGGTAPNLAKRGWGLCTPEDPVAGTDLKLLPGDIVSIEGHVWLSLGSCADGSVLILHSAPTLSRSGQPGGGVQLGAIGRDTDCQAFSLAEEFMTYFYPAWAERYVMTLLEPETFFLCGGEGQGVFRWDLTGANGGLTDPDGYVSRSPKQILRDLFRELGLPGSAYDYEEPAPECDPVSLSWFDDAVFIGDSVSVSLSNYCYNHPGALGNAQFLTEGSLSATNALWAISDESVHPKFNGEKIRLEDGVAACGAKNVYIMLGMNNISFGLDRSTGDMLTVIQYILDKSPEVNIIIESVTPMTITSSVWSGSLNNDRIAEYNARMLELCEENGWYFVDVGSVFYDAAGNLDPAYCSDTQGMGIHMNERAAALWIEYLRTHVPEPLM